jgi:hypothetical protein
MFLIFMGKLPKSLGNDLGIGFWGGAHKDIGFISSMCDGQFSRHAL